jgi:hypothetical protein
MVTESRQSLGARDGRPATVCGRIHPYKLDLVAAIEVMLVLNDEDPHRHPSV